MAHADVLPENEAFLLNLFFICILYGVYVPMFLETARILKPRTVLRDGWTFRTSLVLAMTLLFVLETLSVVLNLMRCLDLLIEPRPRQKAAIGMGISLTYLTIPIGDAILLYRCYLVYACKKRIIAVPFAIWFISCGAYVGDIIAEGVQKGGAHVTSLVLTVLIAAGAIMTFILNGTLTTMIAYKIWKAYKAQRETGLSSDGGTRVTLHDAQRIVIETGSLWLAAATFALGASLSRSNIGIIATGIAKHTSGIAFSLIILRVSWKTQGTGGSSFEQSGATPIHHASETSSGMVFAAPKTQDASFAMLELPKRDSDPPTPATRVINFA